MTSEVSKVRSEENTKDVTGFGVQRKSHARSYTDRRADTWTAISKTPDVIGKRYLSISRSTKSTNSADEFIQHNWFEDHWLQVAERARDLLKAEIDKSHLQAIVSCRAKEEKSLREKLKMRYKTEKYQTLSRFFNWVLNFGNEH